MSSHNTYYGWITPNGHIWFCKRYKHNSFDDFKNLPDYELIRDKEEHLSSLVDYAYKKCEEQEAEGDHPEWHNYHVAESDYDHEMIRYMYEEGFMRFAPLESTNEMHFQYAGPLKSIPKGSAEAYAIMNGYDPVFNLIKL